VNAQALLDRELERFDREHPRSRELAGRARGERFETGVAEVIERHGLPWHVTRLGCRVEYLFRPERPRTGSEAAAGGDALLDRLIHLYALNRGILLTPFHNMALMSPATTQADVDRHTGVFDEAASELASGAS
jgi:glutamate-1-semialdehyde aminotransferase